MSPRLPTFIGISALLLLVLPVAAQNPASTPETANAVQSSANPFAVTESSARLSLPIEVVADQPSPRSVAAIGKAMLAPRARTEAATLMIVGGAGVLTGILIDEGLISFLGAGVGLYGLYLYLR